jgi:hypothetical protein
MLTRRQLADAIDEIEADIKALNTAKADLYAAYRADLDQTGMAKDAVKVELAATKAAIAKRRALTGDKADDVRDKDDLADAILAEIMPSHVHVHVREGSNTAPPEYSPGPASGVASGKHAPAARSEGDAVPGIPEQAGERTRGSAGEPAIRQETAAHGDTKAAGGEASLAASPQRTLSEIAGGYRPAPIRKAPVTDDDLDDREWNAMRFGGGARP